MNIIKDQRVKLRARRTFLKQGTCSRTFFHILNREFGHPNEDEEHAIDPMAGGIVQHGYQCGMLWGASMAIGAESLRRSENLQQAIGRSIQATQHLMTSFSDRTKSIACDEISGTDFTNKWSFAKYMLSGKFLACFQLAGKWAPEAVRVADEALDLPQNSACRQAVSCASEVVKRMGGSDHEVAMVAGFAGGLGLSGSGCGALSAALWKVTLEKVRKKDWKYTMMDPDSEAIIQKFFEATDYEMECNKITDRRFDSIEEHTRFIQQGGCEQLIELLSKVILQNDRSHQEAKEYSKEVHQEP